MRKWELWDLFWVEKWESKTSYGRDLERKRGTWMLVQEILSSGLAWVLFILVDWSSLTSSFLAPAISSLLFLPSLCPFSFLPSWEVWLLHLWSSVVASNGWISDQVSVCLHQLIRNWRLSLCAEPAWNCGNGLLGVHFSGANSSWASLSTHPYAGPSHDVCGCLWNMSVSIDGLMDMQIDRPDRRTQERNAHRK